MSSQIAVTPKSMLKSKTLWANVLMIVAALLTSDDIVRLLGPVIGTEVVAAIVTIVNVILRVFTITPINNTPGEAMARTKDESGA